MRKLIFILPFILFSCVTQQRCLEKFPPDTITTIEYRDTILPVYIVGKDTIWKYGTIRDTIKINNGTAHTIVVVRKDTVKVALWQSDSIYIIKFDSLQKVIKIREQFINEIKKQSFMDKLIIVVSLICACLFIIFVIKLIRR